MNFSLLAGLDGTFKSFFASLATSVSYDIVFYAALAIELFIIFVFAIKSKYAYEIRMTKSLDKLNRWLFHYKTITKDNVKEFTNLMKKAPKRLTYNWQQYILYRDKAPSEYMSIDNIIDKPLRTSSYSLNIRNMNIISIVWIGVVFMAALAKNNANDTIVNATMLLSSLVIPVLMSVLLVLTNIIFTAKKSSNLDELYQNLHLFNRFVDNACTELPKYIDYSLLFTNQEIERGIPELREYYENRARKEKEEFEKAQEEEEKLEQYDFSAVGIDGSNILERALKECEIYLNKKAKILANISERESSLESLKKSFDNIQKEFQKKMQVSKENVDRLRQQQEETTSRIEGNFLRRQMESTIAKQENEEAEYENQKRNYLAQKAEYEDQIKNFNIELEKMREHVTIAMESEYETFYEKLFKASVVDAENKVREKFNGMREERDTYEEELTDSQTKLKRLIDENETLRNKLGITETSEILLEVKEEKGKKKKESKPEEELFFDHSNDEPIISPRVKKEETPAEDFMLDDSPVEEEKKEEPAEDFTLEEATEETESSEKTEDASNENEYDFDLDDASQAEEQTEEAKEEEGFDLDDQAEASADENEYAFSEDDETQEESSEEDEEDSDEDAGEAEESDGGSEYEWDEEPVEETPAQASKKSRGRPKGTTKPKKVETGPKKGRGRPKGTTKPKPAPTGPKKGRGRPKKAEGLDKITQRINEEEQRLIEAHKTLNKNLQEVAIDLETKSVESLEREKLNQEINELKQKAKLIKDSGSSTEFEEINKQIESLIKRIQSL